MSVKTDRDSLNQAILVLKARFDNVDLGAINDANVIRQHLDHIDDVFIQVQQFKSRCGVNDWLSWGHNLWGDIERNRVALENALNRIERKESKILHIFDRRITLFSLALVTASTVAAAFTAYFVYLSLSKSSNVKVEAQSVEVRKQKESGE